ncbi:MAG: M14 family zinc carboxypeptidase [Phycisphaerales bacterium]
MTVNATHATCSFFLITLFGLCSTVCFIANAEQNEQSQDRIVRIQIDTPRDLAMIAAVGGNTLACEVRPGANAVLLSEDAISVLAAAGLSPVLIDADPHGTARAVRQRALSTLARGDDVDWWADYKPLDAIYAKMDEMRARRPDLVEVFEFGRSHEDRPLRAMRITAPASVDAPCRPAVLFNTLTHAREWVPPMANMFVAETLIADYDTDPYIRDLVDRVEWVFVPVLNPDGYEHSWTEFRFWRKNRRDAETLFGRQVGVDLNRNYSFEWGLNRGSSGARTSDTYRGPEPFSEPETAAFRDLAVSMPQLRIHNDMHSYSELILFSWGYTGELTSDQPMLQAVGEEMRDRIAAYRGIYYEVGPVFSTIYPVSGGANDWFYGQLGVGSYTYEIGQRFDETASEMRQLVVETLPASLFHGEYVADVYQFRADFNRDCRHNFFDIAEYLNAYIDASPDADTDGSGVVTPQDVAAFIELFIEKR